MARQPAARLDHGRRARPVGRARRARHHVQPDHLPEGDLVVRRVRRPVPRAHEGWAARRCRLLDDGDRRHRARPPHPATGPRRERGGRRLRLGRGGARAGPRLRRDGGLGARPARSHRRAEPVRQGAGHVGGCRRHPHPHRRGPQHQRHAHLWARPLPRGDGGLHLRAGGLRRRPVTDRQRGLVLRQPGGHRGRPSAGRHRHRRRARHSGGRLRSRRPSSPTSGSSRRSGARAGRRSPIGGPGSNDRCGPRRRPRTRTTRTRCTSTR